MIELRRLMNMSNLVRSSRLRKSAAVCDSEPALDISSLIDVSFLLLIYFLVTTTLMKKEVDVGFQIPPKNGQVVAELSPMHVALLASGEVIVGSAERGENLGKATSEGEHPMLAAALVDYKNAAARAGSVAVVRLEAADGSNHQHFAHVVNALQSAGIDELVIDSENDVEPN